MPSWGRGLRGEGRGPEGGIGASRVECTRRPRPAHAARPPIRSLPAAEEKSTGSILDDIGSMFDDLADQLDAMLE